MVIKIKKWEKRRITLSEMLLSPMVDTKKLKFDMLIIADQCDDAYKLLHLFKKGCVALYDREVSDIDGSVSTITIDTLKTLMEDDDNDECVEKSPEVFMAWHIFGRILFATDVILIGEITNPMLKLVVDLVCMSKKVINFDKTNYKIITLNPEIYFE